MLSLEVIDILTVFSLIYRKPLFFLSKNKHGNCTLPCSLSFCKSLKSKPAFGVFLCYPRLNPVSFYQPHILILRQWRHKIYPKGSLVKINSLLISDILYFALWDAGGMFSAETWKEPQKHVSMGKALRCTILWFSPWAPVLYVEGTKIVKFQV